MKSKQLVIAVMVSVFSLGICQSVLSQDKPVQTWSAKSQSTDYRIGAGDMIEVSAWKEQDLSRKEILVRLDGKISFPLIGDIQAAGMTPVELTETIQKGLANFVTAPVVTVTVTNPGSQKVYVLGEVMRTGEYPILKSLTVLQAFALAGGFTQWASKDEILLIRKDGARDRIYKINYKDIVRGKDAENNLVLQANDTIVVP